MRKSGRKAGIEAFGEEGLGDAAEELVFEQQSSPGNYVRGLEALTFISGRVPRILVVQSGCA